MYIGGGSKKILNYKDILEFPGIIRETFIHITLLS